MSPPPPSPTPSPAASPEPLEPAGADTHDAHDAHDAHDGAEAFAGAGSGGPQAVRLRGPGDLVATLPYHLGYQPTDSLVVVGLQGPRSRMGFVARVDLPPAGEDARPTAEAVVPPVLAQGPRQVLLVAYEDGSPRPGSSRRLSRTVRDLVRDAGVEVPQRLLVRDGRFYSLDCHPSCCPREGEPVPAAPEVPAVAEYVLLGRSPLPRRDALADLVRPGGSGPARLAAVAALGLDYQGGGTGGRAGTPQRPRVRQRTSRRGLHEWALAGWAGVLAEPASGDHPDDWSPLAPAPPGPTRDAVPPGTDLGALLVASLRDVALRDLVITWLCPGSLDLDLLDRRLVERAEAVLPVKRAPACTLVARLEALCRAAPAEASAPPLTVLANLAWWDGDGALARTALEAALRVEPDYRLALLLERMLDLAVPPRRGRVA